MPHYHIVEATEAVKPVLGEYFVEPEKSGPIPFHLIKGFFKGTEVGSVPVGEMCTSLLQPLCTIPSCAFVLKATTRASVVCI